jgi:maleate isomerase
MTSDVESIRPAAWAGVLVPPSNPTVEPELQCLLAPAMTLFAARFATMPGTTIEERNERYLALYRDAVTAFGELKLAAIVIGLTGPSYRLRPARDLELMRELTAHAGGIPVATASQCIAQALTAIGARRIALLSPYSDGLTREASHYWRDAGLEVLQIVKISDTFRAYSLTGDEVTAALARVEQRDVDTVVMSGTGMLTLPAVLAARQSGSKPLLSSNLCSAWWLLRTAGQRAASALFARAAPELAAHLRS